MQKLEVAWTFHTHALDEPGPSNWRAFTETTPVLFKHSLIFTTPFAQIFAIDAVTGKQLWSFDPKVDRKGAFYILTSRGVSLWHAKVPGPGLCEADRVFVPADNRRLYAVDANTGEPCHSFGDDGSIDLTAGLEFVNPSLLFFNSPPAIVGDTVIIGSGVGDNQITFAASGAVRGISAVTGEQLWSWEPLPWALAQQPHPSGSGNTWAVPTADPEHDLVFLPTGSASVDFFGGNRPGDNRDADSIVALRASTGEKVWSFQFVHHDVWDYDTPSQPVLFDSRNHIPAVAITTKFNMVYVFNRLTGKPLFPIEERPVPQSSLPDEKTSPTQPFSSLPPLSPLTLKAEDIHLHNADDQAFCSKVLSTFDNSGLFTPPSLNGSIENPGNAGGTNWGSSALDPNRHILYTRVSTQPFAIVLSPRNSSTAVSGQEIASGPLADHATIVQGFKPPPDKGGRVDVDQQQGTPYVVSRGSIVAPGGSLCAPTPYGSIVATDLDKGKQLWSTTLGEGDGAPGTAGVLGTAGELVFAADDQNPFLYGFETKTGKQIWKGQLPAPANADPMSYTIDGRQFIVIAAGVHSGEHIEGADTVVAFALPTRK